MSSLRSLRQAWSQRGPYIFAGFFLLLAIWMTTYPSSAWMSGLTKNYLSVHIVLEFISILVSFGVATVGWATYNNGLDVDILVLGIMSVAIGMLDLGHTLAFTGMPDFFGASGPNKAIAFWLASRSVGALSFLYVALSRPRENKFPALRWILLAVALISVAGCYYAILDDPEALPIFFINGSGLTHLKIVWEWAAAIVSVIASCFLFFRAETRANVNARWMACACFIYGLCGYFFTMYHDFDDLYVFTGHIFKAVASLVLYRAIFAECVSKPYEKAKALAAQASEASLAKSRFLANVSHELRTPLGVIIGFSDLLLHARKLDPLEEQQMQTIARNARQLHLLIDDLLDLTKAESEKIDLHVARFDLCVLLKNIESNFQLQAKQKGLQFSVAIDSDAHEVWVLTDEMRLRQVLMNVVGNAFKFTTTGSIQIRLAARRGDEHRIFVKDTGLGISANQISELFKPFSQLSDPSGRRFAGTGLGLSLSRKFAELLGGNVQLVSSKVGAGSEFAITFLNRPFVDPVLGEEMSQAPAAKRTSPNLAGRRILVVEDSIDNQALIKSYLRKSNAGLTIANNGAEAIEIADDDNFYLILMDIQMPVMDGFEATRQLRSRSWSGPIVALTAHALQAERDRALANGFTDYLVKPIAKERLWTSIESNLAHATETNS